MQLELIFVLGGLTAFGYLIYSIYYLDSGPWKRQCRWIIERGVESGLTPNPERAFLKGELEGLEFELGLVRYRGSKTEGYKLRGKLRCPGWEGVEVNQEDIISGVHRMRGEREVKLEDREVDACFWLEGDQNTLRRLFTSPLREAMLRALPELPGGVLRGGQISSEQILLTPFFVRKNFLAMLGSFRLLALALQGRGQVQPLPEGYVVRRKLRKFARTSLLFQVPLLLVSLGMPTAAGQVARIVLALGLGLTLLALSGRQSVRVLLQAYYAFLTVALTTMILVGGGRSLAGGSDQVGSILSAMFLGLIVAALCWSARHYLRALDLTGITTRQEQPSQSQF